MDNEELLKKIQAVCDESAKKFIRPAKITIINVEDKPDGTKDVLCLGSDMPVLIYRLFNVDKDGNVTENGDIAKAVEATRNYNTVIKPTLKLVPPAVEEGPEYEIGVENRLDNGGVEIKLKSSIGRDVTMIEIYRYFDYVSKIFFVSCVGLSFGGQYLFSVTPDSKHIKLIVGRNEEIKKRIDMMTELLQNRLLPSYQTIAAAAQLLNGQVKAHISLDGNDGTKNEFDSTFCYDDPVVSTRYAFFADPKDQKKGVILICDIFDNNKLITSNSWTEEQKAEVDKFKALMKEKPEEFQKNCCSFFADSLDFRYAAFKAGKLKPSPIPTPSEKPAEAK
jgi:hypothetical protein